MIRSKQGFVGFFDILGFEAALTSPQKALEALVQSLEEARAAIQTEIQSAARHTGGKVTLLCFSDSILLASDSATGQAASKQGFLVAAQFLMDRMFVDGWPLRGSIAKGEFYVDPGSGIFAGKCIAEAYKNANAQDWSGCGIPESVAGEFLHHQKSELLEYPVPTKKNAHRFPFALNWLSSRSQNELNGKSASDFVQVQFDRHGKSTLDSKVKAKLEKTVEFINFAGKNA